MTRHQRHAQGSSAEAVPDTDPSSTARSILLRQLTIGPRTEEQLRQALRKRQVPDDVAEEVLARFAEVGLIDDRAYAESLVRSEAAAGSLSRRRVQQRLREKGVADHIVAEALEGIDLEVEESAALELARRKAARMRDLDPSTARRRLAGVLARRGYSADTVRRVVADVLVAGDRGAPDSA